MENKVEKATVYCRKVEFEHKKDTEYGKKGQKDHFYSGKIFIGGKEYEITCNGRLIKGKDGKPDSLAITVKHGGRKPNVLS